mmetsp:Transcript_140398/g.244473  ORF Transcript_140398/g.244473 Transcript_140398/m.244473 type:complete len:103 (-) Transcript_140398:15-323(-)
MTGTVTAVLVTSMPMVQIAVAVKRKLQVMATLVQVTGMATMRDKITMQVTVVHAVVVMATVARATGMAMIADTITVAQSKMMAKHCRRLMILNVSARTIHSL